MYKWSHILQVPLILIINTLLGWHYYKKGADRVEDPYRFGPLALHILGTCLVLVQPVFDKNGGILADMQHGYGSQTVHPPKFTQGGFWHHGYLMAAFSVSGLLCIASASLWSSGVFEKANRLLEDSDKPSYGSESSEQKA
eukprot:TRINITY_DN55337_c0_g1_i1.p1 TRINITY_DN55337_c0_g1~~TRINITY_DN55337_c0_g1_i1.p1  ORF type:complete len:140 (-),score=17.21 TRINITY_DN55337_c0_g1_i1:89-508(-)